MKKLIPILLLLVGTGAGIGGGFYLRPAPPPEAAAENGSAEDPARKTPGVPAEAGHGAAEGEHGEDLSQPEYVKLNNQFVVPVVEDDRVRSLVVLSLGVEIGAGQKEMLFAKEPKLRDVLLQELFSYANMGGFQGAFTNARKLDVLRNALREAAQLALGEMVSDVLIIDIIRQDS